MSNYISYEYAPAEIPAVPVCRTGLPFEEVDPRTGAPILSRPEVLIVRPSHNSHGKHDVTGAFDPEAKAFAALHGISPYQIAVIDNRNPRMTRAEEFNDLLAKHKPRVVALFCHGYMHGTQLTANSPGHRDGDSWRPLWEEMVSLLSFHPNPVVILYACSTGDDPDGDPDTAPGSGDGSFADLLRDRLCEAGARHNRVVAHTTAAHTTMNPFVKFFDGGGSPIGGTGAPLLAAHRGKYFPALRRLLRTDWRFKFPFKSLSTVHEDLVAESR